MTARPLTIACLVLLGTAVDARADKQECVKQSEQAQAARTDGHLVSSQNLFHLCARDECPPAVRADCERSYDDVGRSLPTVVFVVRSGGNDVTTARVSVDGTEVSGALSGRSLPLDPGPHHVRVDSQSGARLVEQDVIIHEAEKNRLLEIQVPSMPEPPPREAPPPVAVQGHTAAPWVVVGIGVAAAIGGGITIGVAQSQYGSALSGCTNNPDGSVSCPLLPGQGNQAQSDAMRTSQQSSALGVRAAGIIISGVGLVAIIAGLIWHFAEPTGRISASASVGPGFAGAELHVLF